MFYIKESLNDDEIKIIRKLRSSDKFVRECTMDMILLLDNRVEVLLSDDRRRK